MTTVTLELPDFLNTQIEALAARDGYTVNQFLTIAAEEKLAILTSLDYLRQEATAGRREDFEYFLKAVPDTIPDELDQ